MVDESFDSDALTVYGIYSDNSCTLLPRHVLRCPAQQHATYHTGDNISRRVAVRVPQPPLRMRNHFKNSTLAALFSTPSPITYSVRKASFGNALTGGIDKDVFPFIGLWVNASSPRQVMLVMEGERSARISHTRILHQRVQ